MISLLLLVPYLALPGGGGGGGAGGPWGGPRRGACRAEVRRCCSHLKSESRKLLTSQSVSWRPRSTLAVAAPGLAQTIATPGLVSRIKPLRKRCNVYRGSKSRRIGVCAGYLFAWQLPAVRVCLPPCLLSVCPCVCLAACLVCLPVCVCVCVCLPACLLYPCL